MSVKLLQLVVGVSLCALVIGMCKPKADCTYGISDMVIPLKHGESHTQRCDNYTCNNGKVEIDVHQCENKLYHGEESLCLKWSDDKCCCEVIGCLDFAGNIVPKGAEVQITQPDPTQPKCGEFRNCDAHDRSRRMLVCPPKLFTFPPLILA